MFCGFVFRKVSARTSKAFLPSIGVSGRVIGDKEVR